MYDKYRTSPEKPHPGCSCSEIFVCVYVDQDYKTAQLSDVHIIESYLYISYISCFVNNISLFYLAGHQQGRSGEEITSIPLYVSPSFFTVHSTAATINR